MKSIGLITDRIQPFTDSILLKRIDLYIKAASEVSW